MDKNIPSMCSLGTMCNDLSELHPKWSNSLGQHKCGYVSISLQTQSLTIHCVFCEFFEDTLEYFLEHLKHKHFSMLAVETILWPEAPTEELHIKQEEIQLEETKLQGDLNIAFESAADPLKAEEKNLTSCILKTEKLESVEPDQRVEYEKLEKLDEANNQLSSDAGKPKFKHVCKLIHYIQEYPTLWNTQLGVHYIRSERMSAFESLTNQLLQEYPNLSIDTKYVQNKFKDLKNIYYKYKNSKKKPNKNYEKYFQLLYFLKDHEKTKENRNLCKVCNKIVACLPSHMQKHHCENNTSNTRYLKCDWCDEMLLSEKLLQKHLRAIHRRYECQLCTRAPYTNSHGLRRHMESKHPEIPLAPRRPSRGHPSIKERICEHCGRQFNSQQKLNLHINRVHLQLRPYACPDCHKAFKDLEKLKSHRNSAHLNNREHVCDMCSKAFFDRKTMMQHKRLHSDVMKYVCHVCSKAFRQAPALHSHMKTHQ